MKHLTLILGIFLIVVGGMVALFIQSVYATAVAIAGVVCIAFYVVSNWQQVARRSTFYGFNALLMSLAMVAILSVIYLIAQNRDQTWDFTVTGKYKLDPQTANILDQLENEVEILLFFSRMSRQSPDFIQVTDLLDEYNRMSGRISYTVLDPEKDYETAIEYASDLNPFGQPTIIAEMKQGDKTFREKADGVNQQSISNAIKKVTHREPVTAYFLVGHYERELDGQTATGLALLNRFLKDENIEASELRLGPTAEIPEDADILALVGPQEGLTEEEYDVLQSFALKGGGLFIALDPGELGGMNERLRPFGMEVGNDTVIEMEIKYRSLQDMLTRQASASPSDQIEIAAFDENHEITKQLQNTSVRMTKARSIKKLPTLPPGVSLTELLKTASGNLGDMDIPRSWADSNPEALERENLTIEDLWDPDSDNRGPVTVGVAVELDLDAVHEGVPDPDTPERKGKIVLFADSDFLTNVGMQSRQGQGVSRSHHDLALNSFNWLAGQVDLITIREKEIDNTSVILTTDMKDLLQLICLWIIPVVIAATGITIVLYRRLSYV